MKAFFDKFQSLKGASFIGVRNYKNSYGEIANLVINANINVMNAKQRDLNALKSVSKDDLSTISTNTGIAIDLLQTGLKKLIESAEKNVSENKEDRTVQSNAQSDAYIHLTPAVKMHKESMDIYVTGLREQKTVLVKGEYPVVNSKPLTLAKNAIKKHCNLRMEKYRTFKVGNMDEIKLSGTDLVMK